ncbi:MAG: metal ABC transporter substrate-binding protein [Planctomycetota bacterium]
MKTILPVVILAACLLSAGCERGAATPAAPDETGDQRAVYTVNYPLAYFAERIGGDAVEVHFPAPPDGDPAFWRPDADAIRAYQKASLILLNGADYAKWVGVAALPPSRLVDTSAAFRDRYIEVEDAVTHSHGPGGEHAHTGLAFTTWLDFSLALEQARAIHEALERLLPDEAEALDARFAALEDDLRDLDTRTRQLASGHGDVPLLMSHPVYQYWARAYGLDTRSVHWEPDVVPDAEAWRELDELLEEHRATLMIWEGEPLEESVRQLAERGVRSVVFDPAGNRPGDGDFLAVMRTNLQALEAALAEGGATTPDRR